MELRLILQLLTACGVLACPGELAQAADPYQSAISEEQSVRLKSARTLRSSRELPQAQSVLRELIQEKPDYYLAHYNLGMTYLEQARYDEGIRQLEQATAIREQQGIPEYSIYNTLGWAHLNAENYRAAEQSFRKVLAHEDEIDPQLTRRALDNLGLLYYIRQDFNAAREVLTRSVRDYHSSAALDTLQLVDAAVAKAEELQLERYVKLAIQDGEYIGNRLWRQQGATSDLVLTQWAAGEQYATMGIGRFIWYPAGREGPYQESFPAMIRHLEHLSVQLPGWLTPDTDCPWDTREAFLADLHSERMNELRRILKTTIPQQVDFMTARLRDALPKMLESVPADRREHVSRQFHRVARGENGRISREGLFALLDYVHFKGEGTRPAERYQGKGWGLLQVLERMPGDSDDPLQEFIDTAIAVLERRIELAPPERDEQRWLKGWKRRIESYREPLVAKGA